MITATNRDPRRDVDAGRFREDLYYRVAVVMLRVPPLRERRDDIPLLVEHFITRFSAVYKKPICGIEPAAMDRLVSAPWPGNVRQLENLLEQAVVLADRDTLTEEGIFREAGPEGRNKVAIQLELGLPLEEVERRYILQTLDAARGNRTETARRLGISLRCLQYKLRAYRRCPDRYAAGARPAETFAINPQLIECRRPAAGPARRNGYRSILYTSKSAFE